MSHDQLTAARRAGPSATVGGGRPVVHGGIPAVVRTAAVLDEPFSIRELALVLERSEGEVALAVGDALATGWFIDVGTGLRFTTDGSRAAARDGLGPSVVRSLQRAAGRTLAASGLPVQRVASLFSMGGEPGDREAIDWLIRGAESLLTSAPEGASRLLHRALELADSDVDRARISALLARALTLAGRASEAADVAIAALWRPHERVSEVELTVALARALRSGGRPTDAADLLGTLLERVTDATGPRTRARLRVARADALMLAGRLAAGDVEGAAGLDLALDAADDAAVSEARAALARSRLWRGDVEGALDLSTSAAQAALVGGDEDARRDALYLLAMHLMHADRFEESAALFVHELDAAGGDADRRSLVAHRGLGFVAYHRGRWTEARSRLLRGWSAGLGRATPMDLIPSLAILAVIDLGQGRAASARAWVDLGFQEVERAGSRFSIEWPLWARAMIHEVDGDLARANRDVHEAIEAMRASGTAYRLRFIGPDATRIAAAAGEGAFAAGIAEEVASLADDDPRLFEAVARLSEGLATGDPEPLMAAVELFRRTERIGDLAVALEGAGTTLARRQGRGRPELREALAIFETMGAEHHAARVRGTLRRHGWRSGPRSAHRRARVGWGSLTAAERTVAGLVAEGLTNRQVAGRLFVSPRTVETHVARLRAKLGVTSRVAIAGEVRQALEDAAGHP